MRRIKRVLEERSVPRSVGFDRGVPGWVAPTLNNIFWLLDQLKPARSVLRVNGGTPQRGEGAPSGTLQKVTGSLEVDGFSVLPIAGGSPCLGAGVFGCAAHAELDLPDGQAPVEFPLRLDQAVTLEPFPPLFLADSSVRPRNSPAAAAASSATTTGEAASAEGATTAEPGTSHTRR
jgi:hypothetical protein